MSLAPSYLSNMCCTSPFLILHSRTNQIICCPQNTPYKCSSSLDVKCPSFHFTFPNIHQPQVRSTLPTWNIFWSTAMDWNSVCVLLKSMLKPNTQSDGVRRWGLYKVINHEDGASRVGLGSLWKRRQRAFLLSRKQSLTRHWPCWGYDLEFPASRPVKKQMFAV